MNRRRILAGAVGVFVSLTATAQPQRTWRIGYLGGASEQGNQSLEIFRCGMRNLG